MPKPHAQDRNDKSQPSADAGISDPSGQPDGWPSPPRVLRVFRPVDSWEAVPAPSNRWERVADRYLAGWEAVARGCRVFGLIAAVWVLGVLLPDHLAMLPMGTFILAVGVGCALGFWRAGTAHCAVTGAGLISAGVLMISQVAAGASWLGFYVWLLIAVAIIALGFAFEAIWARTHGGTPIMGVAEQTPDPPTHAVPETPQTVRTLATRTGPVSRLIRVALAAAAAWFAYDLFTDGLGGFSDPSTPTQPGFWIIIALVVGAAHETAVNVGQGPRAGRRAVAVFVGLAGVAALITLAISGAVWAVPLTWLTYGTYLGFLGGLSVLFAISAVVGTPGCEIGVLPELIGRVRGRGDQTNVYRCGGVLDGLDAWEARHRHAKPTGRGTTPDL